MKRGYIVVAVMLFACAGIQLAFGWGNATHVYFAKELGAKFGFTNMNEMYGSLMPDCFNLIMTEPGQYLHAQTHINAMPVWQAAKTPVQRALAFGFMTHNQSWGADYTAHVKSFVFPTFVYPPTGVGGYAVEKGVELTGQLAPVLLDILLKAGVPEQDADGNPVAATFAWGLAPELGHDLSETAVDLLVKRNIDRAIGARMVLAAQCRPANAGALLVAAYAADLVAALPISQAEATALIIGAEKEYQKSMVQYGMAFTLPEQQTIALLAEQTVPVAEMYIDAALDANGISGIQVTVTAAQISDFIRLAIDAVKPDYARELSRTLCFIEKGLREHGIREGCGLFAFDAAAGDVASDDVVATPRSFALAQNSPNPFNPSTTISYALPGQAHVRLIVYNALGQEVATLVNDDRPAGSYTVRWDAGNQPSGAYFYRIESGAYVETKKMMLVK